MVLQFNKGYLSLFSFYATLILRNFNIKDLKLTPIISLIHFPDIPVL